MADRITLNLWEPVQAHKALMHAWTHAKAWLMAGHRCGFEACHAVISRTAQEWGVA